MNSQCCSAWTNILTYMAWHLLLRVRNMSGLNVRFDVGGFGTGIVTQATEIHSIFFHVVFTYKVIQMLAIP